MSSITVIGSISNDFVIVTQVRPNVGETVEGESFSIEFGGKGANQAVAISRLGVSTTMIGAVGSEALGSELVNNLRINNIDVTNIFQKEEVSSGSAIITVSEGDNSIIYVPGANQLVDTKIIDCVRDTILNSKIVVVQNEIPLETVNYIIDLCYDNNVPILLNPAPARMISESTLEKLTYLTPNESEFELLFDGESIEQVLYKYPNKLIVTLGSKGAVFYDGKEIVKISSNKVSNIVDTTGAGDTFNGGFAVGIAKGLSILESIKLGNLAASLSIQKFGAQGGMPTADELRESEFYEKEWNIE